MAKSIYVEGAILATTGDLYSHNIIAGGSFYPFPVPDDQDRVSE